MTVTIEKEVECGFSFDEDELIRTVIEAALDYENCPYDAEVSVTLTDNESIREVNRDFRNLDRATDVLSFPMADYATPADFDSLEEMDDVFNPETGEYMMGDIMISVEKVKEQAEAYGHSEKRELAFLVAHSMLHLMGYDHEEEEERQVMEKKQEEILQNLNINR